MGDIRHILFIMTDQQRWDYLGAAGHPTLKTPVLDALAADGMLFRHAYCNAPVCGSSRMCFYTGRTVASHGVGWNTIPLPVGTMTLGDHLRRLGVRTALVGKTHMVHDQEGMERLGLDPDSARAILIKECGFEPFERDDGLWPDPVLPQDLAYNRWLNALGYPGGNPWHDFANAAEGPNGEILSGWHLRNSPLPARVREEHSETAYMTDRAIDFIDQAGDDRWCLHLSYIKPHWPYMAPAPYHAMYSVADIPPVVRDAAELEDPHPVYAAFLRHGDSRTFAQDGVREAVIPAYMGLISQIDAHLGRLFHHLRAKGLWEHTLIVFTSDHGDYLGDHWLGEKELFHDASVRIPLIVRDPRAEADGSRGAVCDRMVESIDLVPTFVEAFGGRDPGQWLEGRSLLPLLEGTPPADWRDGAVVETDYALRGARLTLEVEPAAARGLMIRTHAWKYVHWHGFRPQLFDLATDPGEIHDLGASPRHAPIRRELKDKLFDYLVTRRARVTLSDRQMAARTDTSAKRGYKIGVW